MTASPAQKTIEDILSGEPETVAGLLAQQLKQDPGHIVYTFNGATTSFAELDAGSNRVANALVAAGLKPQDRVAYLGFNDIAYFEALLGAAKAGMVMVGINWRLAAPELAYVLNDAAAQLLILGDAFLPLWEAARADCSTVRSVVMVEREYPAWRDAQRADAPTHPVGPEDVLVQMYTSGTTGHPKGVLLTHRTCLGALVRGKLLQQDWTHWGPEDTSMIAMPTFHIGGTSWGMQGLYHGGHSVILPTPDITAMFDAIEAHKVSKVFMVPAVLQAMTQHPRAATADMSSMREVLYGASPIPLEVLKAGMRLFPNAQFVQLYGMTEACGAVTYLPPEDHSPDGSPRMASCGLAYPLTEIRIVDQHGNSLPPGEVGEILVKCNSLMSGYYNRAEATSSALKDGWYYSGDAGYLDADGYLYIHDRIKDMIVSGAENIYPAEVENALHEHADIADCAVIGVPDEKWGEAVKALVVRKAGSSVGANDIISFLRGRIAGYKVPKSIDFVDDLPRNPSGKILKRELRKKFWPEGGRMVN